VAPLTQDDARDLFAIIGAIEALAAQHAAALERAPRARLVSELRRLNGALAQAANASRPDPLRIFDLDTSFHRTYVEAGAGLRLLALHDAIKPQAERYVRLYTSALVDEIGRSVEEHDKIVEQIDAGSAEGAWRAVQRNWRNAAARLSRVILALGERGSW
jgi:DNA-binding GntR family transcriptional regulator